MSEIFMIQARRCKRCGRLLVNQESVEQGYGCQCIKKTKQEEIDKQPINGQMELFDFFLESGGKDA